MKASWIMPKGGVKQLLRSNPLTKKENVTIFMNTLSSAYYDRLTDYASASFVNLLQTEECIRAALRLLR